ncbi:MAG: hypothetical protein HFE45_11890 [Oscillospiraceae bacterium]|nr:hypothetical protein [Oscillospiraceae bacterium]
MANPKGNLDNLQPVSSKEEAKKRGSAGGKKSGEARRRKRDARQAISLLLNMAASGKLEENLAQLGFDADDRTNMNALMARMFTKAMSGDVAAFKALMDYGGYHPDQKLKDRERRAHISAMEASAKDTGIAALGDDAASDDESVEDTIIYLPENGREGQQ